MIEILFPVNIDWTSDQKIRKKIIIPDDTRKKLDQHVQTVGCGGYSLILRKETKRRSDKQNRYFHGYLLEEIRKKKGFLFIDQVKDDIIKPLFLEIKFEKRYKEDGEIVYDYIPSKYFSLDDRTIEDARTLIMNGIKIYFPTSQLKTNGQEMLNSDIRMWASMELGLYLRLPNETD